MAHRTTEKSYAASFRPPERGKYGLLRVPPPKVHVTACMTGGLKHLYDRIKTRSAPQKQHERGYYTNSNGVLTIRQNMPLLANRYRVVTTLGKGQSSILIKAEDLFHGGELVAVKVLHKHYQMLGAQETDCVRRLNIADPDAVAPTLRLRTVFQFDDHYCMVFEMLSPGPLTELFLKWNRSEALVGIRRVARYVLTALGFLQQHEVIHADLKPENILLKKVGDLRSLKVVDFGNAIHCIHEELSLYYDDFELQTLLYRAPEVMFGLSFGVEIDLWSLGCVLAELYLGKPLFSGRDKNDVMRKMVEVLGPIPEEMCRHGKFFQQMRQFTAKIAPPRGVVDMMNRLGCFDYAFIDFLVRLLKYRPSERMTVTEAACHPFLAAEGGAAFFLPVNGNNNGTVGYPNVLIDRTNYNKKPVISEEVQRRRMASVELLHTGTSSDSRQAFEACSSKWPFIGRRFKPEVLPVLKPTLYSPASQLPSSPTVAPPLVVAQRTLKSLATNGRHSASAISLPSGGHIESYKTSRGTGYSAAKYELPVTLQQANASKYQRTLSNPVYSQSASTSLSSSSNHQGAAPQHYAVNKPTIVVQRPYLSSTSGSLSGANIATPPHAIHNTGSSQITAQRAQVASSTNINYLHNSGLPRANLTHAPNMVASPSVVSNPSSPHTSYSPHLSQNPSKMSNAERQQQLSSLMQQIRQQEELVEDLSVKRIKIEPTSPSIHPVAPRRSDLNPAVYNKERPLASSQVTNQPPAVQKPVSSNHRLDPSQLRLPLNYVAAPDQNRNTKSLYLNCGTLQNANKDFKNEHSGSASAPIISVQPPPCGRPMNSNFPVYDVDKSREKLSSHLQSPTTGSPSGPLLTPTRSPLSVGTPSSDRSTPENNGDQQKSRPLKKRIRTNLYDVFSKSEDLSPHKEITGFKPRMNGALPLLNTTYTCFKPTISHDESKQQLPKLESGQQLPFSSQTKSSCPSPGKQNGLKPTHDDNDNKILYNNSSEDDEEEKDVAERSSSVTNDPRSSPLTITTSPSSIRDDLRSSPLTLASSPLTLASSPSNQGSSPLGQFELSNNNYTHAEIKDEPPKSDHSDTDGEESDSKPAAVSPQRQNRKKSSSSAKANSRSTSQKSRLNGTVKAPRCQQGKSQKDKKVVQSEASLPRPASKRKYSRDANLMDQADTNGSSSSKRKRTTKQKTPLKSPTSNGKMKSNAKIPKPCAKSVANKTPQKQNKSSDADEAAKLWRSPRNVPKQSYYLGDSSDDEVYTLSEHIWYNEESNDSEVSPVKTLNGLNKKPKATKNAQSPTKTAVNEQSKETQIPSKAEKLEGQVEVTPVSRSRRLPQRVAVMQTPTMRRQTPGRIPSSKRKPPARVRVAPPSPESPSPSKRSRTAPPARVKVTPATKRSAKTPAVISPAVEKSRKTKQAKGGRTRERRDSLAEADQYINGSTPSDSSCSAEEHGEVLTLSLCGLD